MSTKERTSWPTLPSMQWLMGSTIARLRQMPPRAVACAHPTAAAQSPSHRSELEDGVATGEPPPRLTGSSVRPEIADPNRMTSTANHDLGGDPATRSLARVDLDTSLVSQPA
jgi:hypothetical protein